MAYQFRRERLTPDEANLLAGACRTGEECLVIWTLLVTGLRVGELGSMIRDNIEWQGPAQRLDDFHPLRPEVGHEPETYMGVKVEPDGVAAELATRQPHLFDFV